MKTVTQLQRRTLQRCWGWLKYVGLLQRLWGLQSLLSRCEQINDRAKLLNDYSVCSLTSIIERTIFSQHLAIPRSIAIWDGDQIYVSERLWSYQIEKWCASSMLNSCSIKYSCWYFTFVQIFIIWLNKIKNYEEEVNKQVDKVEKPEH